MNSSIAHLSDPHITTGPLAAAPAAGLQLALARVLALEPQPLCVVLSGDLVENGRPEEYAALQQIIGRFPLPVHLVAGNHDAPKELVEAFDMPSAHYSVDYDKATIVVLNSHVPKQPGGHLGAEQLSWLEETLARRPGVPAFVVVHHPPVPIGIPFVDGMRLEGGEALGQVLARHPHVVRVLSGHIHRAITADFAGTTVAVAPSTYRQSTLTMEPGGQMGYLAEPTGFLLHLLPEGGGCITHTVAVSHAAAPLGAY